MKTNKIVICTLAAGLMAFASGKAQGAVIDNELYVPLNINGSFSYVDNNKIKTAKFTTKDILNYLEFPKGTQLAVYDNDVYAINKTNVLENLTTDDILFFTPDEYIGTEGSKFSEAGTVNIQFYSDGENEDIYDNDYAFFLNGTYIYNGNESAVKNGYYNLSIKFSTKNLSGYGYDYDVNEVEVPVTGSASGSGSGKLQELE